ncbi:Putative C6 transcription factor [Aspergillus calidoustus]|uniref:Putative C6 transcription factor n=1 Tax=Aspergillus calidoustus TaxID=454130 RepID=A0A0U5GFR8_ASPCI|nr:Putative C6 transcription factor [Aspergillus calidoustus]
MERSPQSSAYGQACTHCYKAKCRCVRARSGETCERCLRLKKRCEPSESVRRRNLHNGHNAPITSVSDRRIARLEDKLENLLSVMQSFIGSTTGNNVNTANAPLVTPASTALDFSEGPTATVSPNPDPVYLSNQYQSTPSPSLTQIDDQLEFFRTRMLPSFPFLDLGPAMTSGYLRQHRPFLLRAIHTVTTFSTNERLTKIEELKRLLFSSAWSNVDSNIDLLLGVLTYLAWSTDPFLGGADLVSRLMMLAISLVYDLRLFKPSSLDVQLIMAITQGRADENGHLPSETPYALLEKQRAVLACFFLSSNVSSHLGRQDALRWTPQMGEALRVIEITDACPADRLFLSQIRLQRLKQRADDIRQQDESSLGTENDAASAPRLLYLRTLRRQLHELRASVAPDLQQIDILNTHAQYVELYINQMGYSISHEPQSPEEFGRAGTGGVPLGFQRLECLWRSVENIKAWLDTFYTIPSAKLIGQPFHFWSQMILTVTLLKYLSTLRDPDWDCQAVRNTVHLISTLDSMLQKLDVTSREPELQCDDHLLKYLTKLLARCRAWAEARWNVSSQTPDGGRHHIPDLDQMAWLQSMDLGDDQWFENALGMPATLS